ncbi:NAD(P)H-binding protein [Nocardia sp. NPDC052566]|uniref:NmrA family NAD(P)-binding protein n=1 Tax=Nocardia sp. NPDC052566 TaxID=3364330 RepID=UPI0037CB4AF0
MKILVTGATGNIGRKVVDHLIAEGAKDVRALSNNPKRAALPAEVEVAEGYLRRLSSLPAAFEGVDRMYLAPVPETVIEVVALAREAGIAHIVDLSGDETSEWEPIAKAVEQSGVAWTHLYAGEFLENTTMWAEQIRTTGQVREPFPDAANAPIAMDDIARVAAAVLLGEGHEGRAYDLTGPETLTRADKVRLLSAALGREVTLEQVSRADAIRSLEPVMGELAEWYVDGLAMMVDHPQRPTTTVAEVTGTPATSFAQWVADNAAAFR